MGKGGGGAANNLHFVSDVENVSFTETKVLKI